MVKFPPAHLEHFRKLAAEKADGMCNAMFPPSWPEDKVREVWWQIFSREYRRYIDPNAP